MAKLNEYAGLVSEKIKGLAEREASQISKLSQELFESFEGGGVWHLFGTGHSHMALEEAFHRAGGLIPVNPWLEEIFMPHAGPSRNGPLERATGLAEIFFNVYKPKSRESLTIISNSGINATSVEMAMIAQQNGCKVSCITNVEHAKNTKSRHATGKKLFELCDLVIDTGGVVGDAAISVPGLDVKTGAMSSILSCTVINMIVIGVCEKYSHHGKVAPIYQSANTPGGDERNKKLEAQYRGRIHRLI